MTRDSGPPADSGQQPVRGVRGAPRWGNAAVAWSVCAFLLVVYHLNGDFLPGNDAKPSVYLAVSILSEGNFSFTPDEMPFMFTWRLETTSGSAGIRLKSWDQSIEGRSASALRDGGSLTPQREKYYVMPSVRDGRYVSLYGPGPALVALPVFGVLRLLAGDLTAHPGLLWHGAKFVASLCVAASAALLFLTASRFTRRRSAVLLALAYGLGTCVWSVSSQTLWQHGPNALFLALGAYHLTRHEEGWRSVAYCGLALGGAVVCRPSSAIVAVAVGIHLLIVNRRRFAVYVLAGVPPSLILAAYNIYYLGAPWRFGQTLRGDALSETVAGSASPWQTPLWEGVAGHLISPSRGLLVYSPFMILALWGMVRVWRRPAYAAFRPLTVSFLILLFLSSKWYDWWGGWSFGYRIIVDTTILLALFLIPTLDRVLDHRWRRVAFLVLLSWSVVVQAAGAFAYNLRGWNARVSGFRLQVPGQSAPVDVSDRAEVDRLVASRGARVLGIRRLNIEIPEHQHRLWSLTDSQIVYYLGHFGEARRTKREMMRKWLDDPSI